MDFGSITDTTSQHDVTAQASATCGTGLPWTLTADDGKYATSTTRQMSSGSATMPYQIYTDTARSTPLQGATLPGSPITGTGTGSPQTITLYGQANPTSLTPGNYSDTVILTITY